MVPKDTPPAWPRAAASTSANVLYGVGGCTVMTMGDLPMSITGEKSFTVS